MNLQVKPNNQNTYPLGGLLIRGINPVQWLQQLQQLSVNLSEVAVFALAGRRPNSLWGCFIILPEAKWKQNILDAIEPCQCLHGLLYIPQYSNVHPILNAAETSKLLSGKPHLLHPEIGLVVLDSHIEWSRLIVKQTPLDFHITTPAPPIFIPGKIQRVERQALAPEQALKEMEKTHFPSKENFNDEPLNVLEKLKLAVLKKLFAGSNEAADSGFTRKPGLFDLIGKFFPGSSKLVDKLEQDLEKLEQRNKSEMEKLMALFKNNPDEALKYAIPLDEGGVGRGGLAGSFEMSRRWQNFDLFGNKHSTGRGGAVFADDSYFKLQQQYRKTATDLVKEGKYERAAFVYLKLLKDNSSAAETLEKGKLFNEAAAVYLQYLNNKGRAAECYEKGQMFSNAIDLYKELKKFEKTGDLYMQLHKQRDALKYYQHVADEHIEAGRYVMASVLMRKKMNNAAPAQELLLEGWRQQKDAYNCINNYFQNIEDKTLLQQSIESIYERETNDNNKAIFLTALKHEMKKGEQVAETVRTIAYEIVAELARKNPEIVTELKNFNNDKSLVKDIFRYKSHKG